MSAELTLPAVLEHPGAGGVRVLVGGDPAWRRAIAAAAESGWPAEASECLAILTGPTPTASWQLDALLRRTRDRGFTGIALTCPDLGVGSAALARRLGLVVLHAAEPLRLAEACWQVLEARDALSLDLVRHVVASVQYRADDLADLLRHVATNTGASVAVVDEHGVLQSAGPPVPASLLPSGSGLSWLHITDSADGLAASVPVQTGRRGGLRVLVAGKGRTIAHRNARATAAQVIMPMVLARLLVDEVESLNEASRSAGVIGEFLELDGAIDPEIEGRMRVRGWRTSGYHIGVRMVGRGRLDPYELLRFVQARLARLPVDSHAVTRGAGIIAWLTFPVAPSQAEVAERINDVLEMHREALQHSPVATGVGSLSSGSAGLARTFQEARDAARLAVGRSRAQWFVHIDRLGLEQLALAWTGGDTFVSAARALLAPLTETERITLTTYLAEESSTGATAQRLGLHRNTVAARIQRIQERLGADLADAETRLAVQLACQVAAN